MTPTPASPSDLVALVAAVPGVAAAPLDPAPLPPDDAFALLLGQAAAALGAVDDAIPAPLHGEDDAGAEPAPAAPDTGADALLLLAGLAQQPALVRVGAPVPSAPAEVDALAHGATAEGPPRGPAAPAAAGERVRTVALPLPADAAPPVEALSTPARPLPAVATMPAARASTSDAPRPALRAPPEAAGIAPAPAPEDAAVPALAPARPLPERFAGPAAWPAAAPSGAASPAPGPDRSGDAPALREAAPALPGVANHHAAPAAPHLQPVATASPAAPATVAVETPAFARGWHEEAAARLATVVLRGHERAEMRLSPADLGPVDVRIDVRNGETAIAIVAAHPATRDALEQALPALREALAQHGLALGEATVRDGRPDAQPERGAFAGGRSPAAGDARTAAPSPPPLAQGAPRLVDTFA